MQRARSTDEERATKSEKKRQRRAAKEAGATGQTNTDQAAATDPARTQETGPTIAPPEPATHPMLGVPSQQLTSAVTVVLLPATDALASLLGQWGHDSTLRLTVESGDKLTSVVDRIREALPRAAAAHRGCEILLQGTDTCPVALRGLKWCTANCDPDLTVRLPCCIDP